LNKRQHGTNKGALRDSTPKTPKYYNNYEIPRK
jgi:hypothetical protein